jgi:hypothetical protein
VLLQPFSELVSSFIDVLEVLDELAVCRRPVGAPSRARSIQGRRPDLDVAPRVLSCGLRHTRAWLNNVELCDRCFDRRIAAQTGYAELPEPPPPFTLEGPDGRRHRMRFRLWRAPTGIEVEVEETKVPIGEGYRVAVLGDHDADVDTLIARARAAVAHRVAHQYLEPATRRSGWTVKDMEVAGRFACDDDFSTGHPYKVVVDGRTLTWEEFGDALESFDGWEFRLEVLDRVEDARTDAEILPFPAGDPRVT